MQFTIVNITESSIILRNGPNGVYTSVQHTLLPNTSHQLPKFESTFVLCPASSLDDISSLSDHCSSKEACLASESAPQSSTDGYSVRLGKDGMRSWHVAEVVKDCPWRIYYGRDSRKQQMALILPKRDMTSFLSEMPDAVPLSSICIPGTHDTLALYGWPISQCQDVATPLPVQLTAGIRGVDIRLSLRDGRLIAYHGAYPQRTSFQTILRTLHDFLTSPTSSREAVIVSIKQEDFAFVHPRDFSKAVRKEIEASEGGMGMWYLDNRIPTLGEVRGRCVMFSRFGGDGAEWDGGLEGLGIHPATWPDSAKEGFTYEIKNTLVRTHDWYAIPSFLSIPEKVERATSVLLPPANEPPIPMLSISYFSAASFPFAAPPVIAKGFGFPSVGFGFEGVNARVGRWLLDKLADASRDPNDEKRVDGPRIRGWVFMDYFLEPLDGSIVPLLVECNFRGRIGEPEWLS